MHPGSVQGTAVLETISLWRLRLLSILWSREVIDEELEELASVREAISSLEDEVKEMYEWHEEL